MSVNRAVFPAEIFDEADEKAIGGIEFDPANPANVTITSNKELTPGTKCLCCITCNNYFLSANNPIYKRNIEVKIGDLLEKKNPFNFKYKVEILP
ncbi:MAG TPA: hypothetical protein PKH50_00995 [bacterium]|nr:hypothetical protein [bacterium]